MYAPLDKLTSVTCLENAKKEKAYPYPPAGICHKVCSELAFAEDPAHQKMAWMRSTGNSHSGKGTQCYNAKFCSDPLISLVLMVGKSVWDKQTMHCFVVILKYWRSTPVVSEPQVYKRNKKVLLVKASKRELLNMNPSDSSSSSQPIHHSTPLCIDRLPSSLKKTLGNKIDQLVEFTHVPEDFRTPATEYPLISPYSFYQRQKKSTLTSIHYLINRNPSPPPKEVIQSYHLQQCGAVRLILTLHERRSLLITAKVALLDTTFKEYQHALIGALVTTLSNGSVILTIAPNFTMRLSDPTISQRLKIQIQLVGVIQDSNVEQATLHHQVLYRVQDHALDLNLPNTTGKRPGMSKQTLLRGPSFRRINMISLVQVQTTHDQHDPPVDIDDKDYARRQRNKKKKKLLQAPCSFKRPEPPDDAESALMPRKKPMLRKTKLSQKGSVDYHYQSVDTIPCIATLRSYEEEFPPLVTQTDEKKITRRPYVIPQGIAPHGYQATTPQEEVLNWHTDNVKQVAELRNRLSAQAFQLDQELKAYIDNRYFGPEFQKKNRELDQVKAQLRQIEMDKSKTIVPQALTVDSLSIYPKHYTLYSPVLFPFTYSPPETPDYDSIFKYTYHLARQANTKKSISPQERRYSSQPQQSQPSLQPRPHSPWKPGNFFREETSSNVPTKDKGIKEGSPAPGRSIYTLTLDTQSHSEKITEESEDGTTETSEQEDEESKEDYEADLSAISMVNPVEEEIIMAIAEKSAS
ncbi:polyprotein [Arachis hypogaea]|nr:polyprotein [Arachis hypogaea]